MPEDTPSAISALQQISLLLIASSLGFCNFLERMAIKARCGMRVMKQTTNTIDVLYMAIFSLIQENLPREAEQTKVFIHYWSMRCGWFCSVTMCGKSCSFFSFFFWIFLVGLWLIMYPVIGHESACINWWGNYELPSLVWYLKMHVLTVNTNSIYDFFFLIKFQPLNDLDLRVVIASGPYKWRRISFLLLSWTHVSFSLPLSLCIFLSIHLFLYLSIHLSLFQFSILPIWVVSERESLFSSFHEHLSLSLSLSSSSLSISLSPSVLNCSHLGCISSDFIN